MTPEEKDAIRKRAERRMDDPTFAYQHGCGGTHRGSCGEGLHHHHDERCAPSPHADILTLLAEVERLEAERERIIRALDNSNAPFPQIEPAARVLALRDQRDTITGHAEHCAKCGDCEFWN